MKKLLMQKLRESHAASAASIAAAFDQLAQLVFRELDRVGQAPLSQVSWRKLADLAGKAANDFPDDLGISFAADMSVALAVLHDAGRESEARSAGGIEEHVRLVYAAWALGNAEAGLQFAKLGFFGKVGAREYEQLRRVSFGRAGAVNRVRNSKEWKQCAKEEFERRANTHMSAAAWSEANAKKYGVKSGTLRKVIRG